MYRRRVGHDHGPNEAPIVPIIPAPVAVILGLLTVSVAVAIRG